MARIRILRNRPAAEYLGISPSWLPSSFGARMALEYVKPSVFVREANATFEAGPRQDWSGPVLVYYPDERRIWR